MQLKPNPACQDSSCCRRQAEQKASGSNVSTTLQRMQHPGGTGDDSAVVHEDNHWGIEINTDATDEPAAAQSSISIDAANQPILDLDALRAKFRSLFFFFFFFFFLVFVHDPLFFFLSLYLHHSTSRLRAVFMYGRATHSVSASSISIVPSLI